MTNTEIIEGLKALRTIHNGNYAPYVDEAIKRLSVDPCEDAISRQAVLNKKFLAYSWCGKEIEAVAVEDIEDLPPVRPNLKIGHCKNCKWWKDSDEIFRRGIDAESRCPINSQKVFEGNGYCYMFEPQESEEE